MSNIIYLNNKKYTSKSVNIAFDTTRNEVDVEHSYFLKDSLGKNEIFFGDLFFYSYQNPDVNFSLLLNSKEITNRKFTDFEQKIESVMFDYAFISAPSNNTFEIRFSGLILRELKE